VPSDLRSDEAWMACYRHDAMFCISTGEFDRKHAIPLKERISRECAKKVQAAHKFTLVIQVELAESVAC
jgi:nitrite reductase/ring-hydroxylating ferredoxin subunit